MATTFTSPLDALLRLQRALDTTRTSDWFGLGTSSHGSFPPINVFRQDDNFVVVAELPGVPRENIDVQIHRDRVRILGKKTIDYGENVSVHRRERDSGSFDRTLTMPFQIDPRGVKAEYHDGILTLQVPPAEQEKPRSINVA